MARPRTHTQLRDTSVKASSGTKQRQHAVLPLRQPRQGSGPATALN